MTVPGGRDATRPARAAAPPPVPARPARHARLGASWAVSVLGACCALAFAAGLAARLWMLAHAATNSDEATVGLMADAILHGHLPAFYWGQAYGGVEPYVVAAMFAVVGHSAYVLNLTAILLAALSSVLTWRLARQVLVRRDLALLAAALSWLWPELALWNSTRELGFRGVTLVCGLVVLCCALRAVEGEGAWPTYLIMGGAAGVGWWASPEILYFAVPVAGLFLARAARRRWRPAARHVVGAVGAAVLGALPWLVANVHSGFASLRPGAVGGPATGSYLSRLHIFAVEVMPMVANLRIVDDGRFLVTRSVSMALVALFLAAVAAAVVALWVEMPPARLLVGFVVAFPFLYAAFPAASFWKDGRYVVYLPPVLAVVLVGGWAVLLGRAVPGLMAGRARFAGLAVTVVGLAALGTAGVFDATFHPVEQPVTMEPIGDRVAARVIASLDAHHVRAVVGDYWIAWDLDFLSAGRIVATSTDSVRDRATYQAVMRAPSTAWLFPGPSVADAVADAGQFGALSPGPLMVPVTTFTARLSEAGVAYRLFDAGPLLVVAPRQAGAAAVASLFRR